MKKSKADLHLHTKLSDGFFTPEKVVNMAVKKGLDVIAVTDHDRIDSAVSARDFALREKLPIEVVVGEEVTSNDGEIIGIFINKLVKHSQSIIKTAEDIKKQGGLVIMPHPLRVFLGFGASFKAIEELFQKNLVDGIEIYNFWDYGFRLAPGRRKKNKKWHLATIGSTDSHHIKTIGSIWTEFPGKTADDLYRAIVERKTTPVKKTIFFIKRFEELRHLFLKAKNGNGTRPVSISFWKKIRHMLK